MFNLRTSGIAAGAAFILSLAVGLISGVSLAVMLLRALVFAALFFAFSGIIVWLTGRFMPELLAAPDPGPDTGGVPPPGSRVDISVGQEPSGGGAFPDGDSDEVDDIEHPAVHAFASGAEDSAAQEEDDGDDIPDSEDFGPADRPLNNTAAEKPAYQKEPDQKGLDQTTEAGYTAQGNAAPEARPVIPSGESDGIDLMADFDALSEAFLPNSGSGGEEMEALVYNTPDPAKLPSGAGKKQGLEGDYDPKDLAQAIQTVLKKDEKG
jgi:hypothetical protein